MLDDKEFFSTKEASEYLRISRLKLYYLVRVHLLDARVCGKRYIYEREELDAVREYLGGFRWPNLSLRGCRECRDELPYR
jgi:excisionase family DNA binding protein